MADDVVAGLGGGCCAALCGNIWWAFGLRNYGGNWTCCDRICRCDCCWDSGQFDPDNMPGAEARQRREQEAKENASTERPSDRGDEDLPAYKAADPMTVPKSGASQAPEMAAAPPTS